MQGSEITSAFRYAFKNKLMGHKISYSFVNHLNRQLKRRDFIVLFPQFCVFHPNLLFKSSDLFQQPCCATVLLPSLPDEFTLTNQAQHDSVITLLFQVIAHRLDSFDRLSRAAQYTLKGWVVALGYVVYCLVISEGLSAMLA